MAGDSKKLFLWASAAVGWVTGVTYLSSQFAIGIDPETIQTFLGEAAANEVTRAGLFFTLAAWIHAGRMKKEISSNFSSLTNAINNVAESLREDLKNHSDKLDNLNSRVTILENNRKP